MPRQQGQWPQPSSAQPVQPASPAEVLSAKESTAGVLSVEGPVPAAVRLSAGFAGFGAGSVNLAISSSFMAGAAGAPGPLLAGVAAGLWGAGLLGGTVVCLARGRVPAGRGATGILLTAAAAHVAALAFGPPHTAGLNLSQLAGLLLTLMMIAALAWLRRSAQGLAGTATLATTRPGRLLVAAFAGAVLVAGITTPGLAASTAGQYAIPHGSHGGGSQHDSHHGP